MRRTVEPDPIDRAVEARIRRAAGDGGAFAGAVVWVSVRGRVMKEKAYGHAELFDIEGRVLPRPRPMRVDAIFDLASVTKAVATTLSLAVLMSRGEASPRERVAERLPQFRRPVLDRLTLEHLLTHTSGLWEWIPLYLNIRSRDEAIPFIASTGLRYPVGRKWAYSDLNFIILGEWVRAASGLPLDRFLQQQVLGPLGLSETWYRPADHLPDPEREARCVATSLGNPFEQDMCRTEPLPRPSRRSEPEGGWRRRVLVGEVNDANCYHALDRVSGHAGLFSTARDLGRIGEALLAAGWGEGPEMERAASVWSREVVRQLARPQVEGQGLGFRTGVVPWSPQSLGHSGFTGTHLLVDPGHGLVAVLLTNRVHGLPPYTPHEEYAIPVFRAIYDEWA